MDQEIQEIRIGDSRNKPSRSAAPGGSVRRPLRWIASCFTYSRTPESGEDKAAQTRRKNAEAQKLYRERKKAHEAGLVNQGNDVLLLEACLHRSDLD